MTCRWRNPDSSTLLQCEGFTPIFSDSQVASFANRVGAAGPNKWGYYYAISCLRINRLIRPDIPEGPCSKLRQVASGTEEVFGIAGALSSADPEPISRAIIGGVGAIGSFFTHLFSGAPSAKELQTQCLVVSSYNSFADTIEARLRSGQMQLSEAVNQLQTVHGQLTSLLKAVEGGTDSAPYGLRVALDALKLYNIEVIYPSLVPPLSSFSFFSAAPGAAPSAYGAAPGGVPVMEGAPLAALGITLPSSTLFYGLATIVVILVIAFMVKT